MPASQNLKKQSNALKKSRKDARTISEYFNPHNGLMEITMIHLDTGIKATASGIRIPEIYKSKKDLRRELLARCERNLKKALEGS